MPSLPADQLQEWADLPRARPTSASRSAVMICSGVCRFLPILHLLAVKLQTRSILTLHLVSFQGVRSVQPGNLVLAIAFTKSVERVFDFLVRETLVRTCRRFQLRFLSFSLAVRMTPVSPIPHRQMSYVAHRGHQPFAGSKPITCSPGSTDGSSSREKDNRPVRTTSKGSTGERSARPFSKSTMCVLSHTVLGSSPTTG